MWPGVGTGPNLSRVFRWLDPIVLITYPTSSESESWALAATIARSLDARYADVQSTEDDIRFRHFATSTGKVLSFVTSDDGLRVECGDP